MDQGLSLPLTAPILAVLAIVILAATGFVVGAMIWLKRLRQHLAGAVGDALTRQIQHGQKVEEALQNLHKHHRQLDAQIETLTQAHGRARADINALAHKLEQRETVAEPSTASSRILH